MSAERNERLFGLGGTDQREPGARDRDRIIYTSAFIRLSGVTQVVSPSEGFICHNRLTHTLKVAQIGRRLAEKLLKEQKELANSIGGLDPEVVEAAALAHDLGHPPFGHVAEETLRELLEEHGDSDGYEGNAQSFRIVTKLAIHGGQYRGLNLTRATINALLKYPWMQGSKGDGKRYYKWGAYRSEQAEFQWARRSYPDDSRSTEAELMDWADDVAYSVHDAEDFFRAGLIPMHLLSRDTHERESFLEGAIKRLTHIGVIATHKPDDLRRAFVDVIESFPLPDPYRATRGDRWGLRAFTSRLIDKYVRAIKLIWPSANAGKRVVIDNRSRLEVAMLKELTWYYVINRPSLATQQYAQKRMIRDLFNTFLNEARSGNWTMFPQGPREELEDVGRNAAAAHVRIVADLIASMTEEQAHRMHHRLAGILTGSVLDRI